MAIAPALGAGDRRFESCHLDQVVADFVSFATTFLLSCRKSRLSLTPSLLLSPKRFSLKNVLGSPGLSLQVPYRLFRLFYSVLKSRKCASSAQVPHCSRQLLFLVAKAVSRSLHCASSSQKALRCKSFWDTMIFSDFVYVLAAFVYNPCKSRLSRMPLLLLPKCFTAQNILVRPLVLAAVS